MAKNRHVYLSNEAGKNDGFKKSRFVPQEEEQEKDPDGSLFPAPEHQDRLRVSHVQYYEERKSREEKRTIDVPAHIDLVRVHFYKVFNLSLQKLFFERYGLTVSSFDSFNKTVLFEIEDAELFKPFVKHLQLFYESSPEETYSGKEYNLIALIHDFFFLSTKKRVRAYPAEISAFSLIPIQSAAAEKIQEQLLDYISKKQKTIYQTRIDPYYFEVSGLSKEELIEIVDNFDVIRAVTSTRTERRRPGVFGEERRGYGFTVNTRNNLPVVGIIDTGIQRIEPLRDCITDVQFDLTGTGAYWDESGHGTSVAGLVALGEEFVQIIKNNYDAKAKLAVIKVLNQVDGEINTTQIINAIQEARRNHGIRLFNLSINDPIPKSYNSAFSDFAYLLDKLAHEEDLLVFISTGNISEARLQELIITEPHAAHEYPTVFYSPDGGSPIHSCETTNIAAPAESMNNISIGALGGNLEGDFTTDITPAKEYPAYYTRKFHYDYLQQVNGTNFSRSQRNKHLNKPDLVFEGGDLFRYNAGIEVLRSPIPNNGDRFFSRSCGTSFANPLGASAGAQVDDTYRNLRTQTIKALLLNSAEYPCSSNPLGFRGMPKGLLKSLMGYGRPNMNGLLYSDNNSVTFVIESEIELEDLQTVKIQLPQFINQSGNKLNFQATLCYSFSPIKDNHLAYLPVQITFGIFKPIDADTLAKANTEDYKIKSSMSWSEDFFGIENRLLSNVQRIDRNISGLDIEALGNQISLAIKCTGKKEIPPAERELIVKTPHKFSLALTVTELPASRVNNRLYADIVAINIVNAIAQAEGEAEATAEAGE